MLVAMHNNRSHAVTSVPEMYFDGVQDLSGIFDIGAECCKGKWGNCTSHEFRNYAPKPVPSVLKVRVATQSFRAFWIWISQAILRIMAGIAGMLPNVRAGFCPRAAVFGRQDEGSARHVGRQCLQVVAGRRTSAAKAPIVLPGAACTAGCSAWVCRPQSCAGR